MAQANLGLVVFQDKRWPQYGNAGLLLGVTFTVTTRLPPISSSWPSARTPMGVHYLWLFILTPTWQKRRGTGAERILWGQFRLTVCSTCPHTSSNTTKPGNGTVGRGTCFANGGRCSPKWTIFWERNTVCSGTSLFGTPGTI